MVKNEIDRASFDSAGLILFNATSSYELMATGHSLDPIRKRQSDKGSWKSALREAFMDAYSIDYEAIFLYAVRILDILPPGPLVESVLEKIYQTSEYVVSRAGLLKHDLAGRIYHSALGRELAKRFATYYTSIPASELLSWIAVEDWDDKVADLACGSGTLLLAAYHKKMSIAFFHPSNRNVTVDDLHRRFVEVDLVGMDAMPFAAHLTLVNLALQQPSIIFSKSQIYHVPVGYDKRMGSLDLLKGNCIWVQQRITGKNIGPSPKNMVLSKENTRIELPEKSFDVVIMNPPFTKKQRVSQLLDKTELKKVLRKFGSEFTSLGGLPLPFILLGDKYIASGGRLALVIPSSILDRSTWKGIRDLLAERYDLEHLIISWVKGKPSFSEDTDLREVLLIARKRGAGSKNNNFTLITHIDKDFSFIEARQIADQLILARSNPTVITFKSPNHQLIYLGSEPIGETISYPKTLIESTSDNWYRLLAFRNPKLVRSSLLQQGIITDSNPPYRLDFSSFQTPVSTIANVGLFIKQVASAGFVVLKTKPVSGGIKSLMTSKYDCLSLMDNKCKWLMKNPNLKAKEKFVPGKGHLLTPRKMNLYSTARVLSVVSDDAIASNMWIPIELLPQVTKDGRELKLSEVSKLLGLWLQSTFGILSLLSIRHEIEGAWSEWVTEDVRNMPILDPKKLDSNAVNALLALWERIKNHKWGQLRHQLVRAIEEKDHPRRAIDNVFCNILLKDSDSMPKLDELYTDLRKEIERLGNLMK